MLRKSEKGRLAPTALGYALREPLSPHVTDSGVPVGERAGGLWYPRH